jgi:hypothetical protein
MIRTALPFALFAIAAFPATAASRHTHQHADDAAARPHITCEMVRSYVAQVGLVQAKAMAEAAGMTAADERRARRCLTNGA